MEEFDLQRLQPILAEFAPKRRSGLLPALQAAQKEIGYLPEPVAAEIGRALGVPLADVFGVIEFYALLSTQPTGRTVFRVCEDPVCALHGGDEVRDALCRRLGIEPGQLSAGGDFQVESVPCLGLCNHAPALLAGDTPVLQVEADRLIAPAGEWLLDNFYLIEEQIRTARRHLPKGYSRELPRLLSGPSAGHPRVYDIALETISHG
ncbi:MAG TPA: NAD(P)H-dependent oxidoreductase subunit E, partial [Anaerolineales bacterium]